MELLLVVGRGRKEGRKEEEGRKEKREEDSMNFPLHFCSRGENASQLGASGSPSVSTPRR